MTTRCTILGVLCLSMLAEAEVSAPLLQSAPKATFEFGGFVGERIKANVENWLLIAPEANPGMIEMFRVRDREPRPQIVPWAGEFVGKYLISAIQSLRMIKDDRLEARVRKTIDDLLDTQADDGYLGPFRKEERLLGHWDLWGHYHVMTALLMWYERTGDARSLESARRAGDLVCRTFLNTGKRVKDAGSPEMNMAILTSLGWLYRITGESKYRAMMDEVLADWETAGDYYRTGLKGIEFYRTPRPRWESLHCIQGLIELLRINGKGDYYHAFTNHWESIAEWDQRNTGGFSSGEPATGNSYEETAIETCCTIAWNAVSIDMLRFRLLRVAASLSAADVLELSFYNAVLGAQHPTGRWWTYNTPMNGIREASAHTIVFQSRAGTPELNCCSVNAPRGLGMLSEWGVMVGGDDLIVNYLGPMTANIPMADGDVVTIETKTNYPIDGKIEFTAQSQKGTPRLIHIRVPTWVVNPTFQTMGNTTPKPGEYVAIKLTNGERQTGALSFEMPVRAVVGDLQQSNRVSLYHGPILLAYDQANNVFDESGLGAIDPAQLSQAKSSYAQSRDVLDPILRVRVPTEKEAVVLCDFASAGQKGTIYRSWLPGRNLPPPVPLGMEPRDNSKVPPGRFAFKWRAIPQKDTKTTLLVAADSSFKSIVKAIENPGEARHVLSAEDAKVLSPDRSYYWKLVVENAHGKAEMRPRGFHVDGKRKPLSDDELSEFGERPDGVLVEAALAKSLEPTYGKLASAQKATPSEEGAKLAGEFSRLVFKLRRFPDENYSAAVWVKLDGVPKRLSQIVSAWARGGDDPLRVCLDNGKLFARMEAGAGPSVGGIDFPTGRWVHVTAVKGDGRLTLYLDGKSVGATDAPRRVNTSSTEIAVGGNPHHTGDESLPGTYRDFKFWCRALSLEEIIAIAKP